MGELCAHFGWAHDHWRRTPGRPNGMGWLEFKAWVRELNRQRSTKSMSPDSWRGREGDEFWSAQDRKRSQRRGW